MSINGGWVDLSGGVMVVLVRSCAVYCRGISKVWHLIMFKHVDKDLVEMREVMFCRSIKRSCRAHEHFCKEYSINLYIYTDESKHKLGKDFSYVSNTSCHDPLIAVIV
jgi:hypothetical protein